MSPSSSRAPEGARVSRLEPRPTTRRGRAWAFVRQNPVTVIVLAVGIVGGAVGAVVLPFAPEGMSLVKKVLGGALLGACIALFPLGYRLFD